jgi:hypothetical protein
LQKPQGTDVSSAARTLAVGLQQKRWEIKAGLTSAMKTPMSNNVFGMAPALFQIGTFEDVISNGCAGSKVIEIPLKPSRRL